MSTFEMIWSIAVLGHAICGMAEHGKHLRLRQLWTASGSHRASNMSTNLPDYEELPVEAGQPPRSSWGLWGPDDELGAINLLNEECVLRGMACAKRGKVFALNWELDQPNPPLYDRPRLKHRIVQVTEFAMDDHYDEFYPQCSSQWDGLSHIGHPIHGYYNARQVVDFTGVRGTKNGVEHWAKRGIVGRGVLLDVARYLKSVGRDVSADQTVEFTVDDLEATRQWSGVTYEVGDILLVRTGWMAWYNSVGEDVKKLLSMNSMDSLHSPGLAAGERMAAYLWNSHFSAVVADNSSLEAWPHECIDGKYLHFDLLALLGIPIGELWNMEELADDCAVDGVYEFLLTSAPFNKLGGVGSPANALAIK